MRERNIFEVAHYLEETADRIVYEVATREEIEKKLEALETLDKKLIEKMGGKLDDERKRKLNELIEETGKARSYLESENYEGVIRYLEAVIDLLENIRSNLFSPSYRDEVKHIQYALEDTIDDLKQFQKREEGDFNLNANVEQFLSTIEKAEKKEMLEFANEIDDEKLKKECEELWKDAENARKYFENKDFSELLKYAKRIKKILMRIHEDKEKYNLNKKYEIDDDNPIGEGREAKVYPIIGHDNLLLRQTENESFKDLAKHMNIINRVPKKVNIARVEHIGMFDGKASEIVERAPGHETHLETRGGANTSYVDNYSNKEIYEHWSRLNSKFAKAPQKHYNKLVEDTKILANYSVNPDPQGSNLFYHEDKGFTWIDLSIYSYEWTSYPKYPNLLELIGCIYSVPKNSKWVAKEDLENVIEIFEKMEKAGFLGGPTKEQLEIIETIKSGEKPERDLY